MKLIRYGLISLLALVAMASSSYSEDPTLRAILQNWRNYQYSNIQLLEISADYAVRLREFFKEETVKKAGSGSKNEKLNSILFSIAKSNDGDRARVIDEANSNLEIREMRNNNVITYEEYNSAIEEAIEMVLAGEGGDNNPDLFFLITTRMREDKPLIHVALLPVKRVGGAVTANLASVQFDKALYLEQLYLRRTLGDKNAPDYPESFKMFQTLIAKSPDERPGAGDFFSLAAFLDDVVKQGSYRDMTLELQAIDNIILKRAETGIAKALEDFRNEELVRASPEDIQRYMRVSEGQAFNYKKDNEINIGFDYVSWRSYALSASVLSESEGFIGADTRNEQIDVAGTRVPVERVTNVFRDSPAELIGLRVDDVILEINNAPVSANNTNRLQTVVRAARPGDRISLKVQRPTGQVINMAAEIGVDLGETYVSNATLPLSGVELRYGMEEINYPSLWSERATLSYIYGDRTLGNVKLGVILPSGLWSTVSDQFAERRFSQVKVGGISTDLNFSTALLKNSGVFNMIFNYVFGDAGPASFRDRASSLETFNIAAEPLDYMIRTSGRLQYTFGMAIDDDFMFRFGIGGAFYVVETWRQRIDTVIKNNVAGPALAFRNLTNETIGDFSARAEFMSVGGKTPFGLSVSYFDRTLGGNLFFQFPLSEGSNLLALRLEGKWFWTAMRDPRAWEVETVVVPTARLIWNF